MNVQDQNMITNRRINDQIDFPDLSVDCFIATERRRWRRDRVHEVRGISVFGPTPENGMHPVPAKYPEALQRDWDYRKSKRASYLLVNNGTHYLKLAFSLQRLVDSQNNEVRFGYIGDIVAQPHNRSLGSQLLELAIGLTERFGGEIVWGTFLADEGHDVDLVRFYRRHGFKVKGGCVFREL